MDVVDFRPVVMMLRPVVIRSALMAVPVVSTTGAVLMRSRVPRIGSNVCVLTRSMIACAMETRTMLAMSLLAFAVRPGTGC